MRQNTRPEGFQVTPPPVLVEAPPPLPSRLTTIAATILGIVVSVGIIIGVLGKAFYVERTEYTSKVLSDTIERGNTQQDIRLIKESQARLEKSLADLSGEVKALASRLPVKTGGRR